MNSPRLTLRNGPLELVLAPADGGCIASFRDDGFDLMRAFRPGGAVPFDMASFPLVPFSGRIDSGRFSFDGATYDVGPAFPPEPHAIHGDGWLGTWLVEQQDEVSATLLFRRTAPILPHRYTCRQRFRLDADTLHATIEVTNEGDAPRPFGLGQHPYFDRRPGTKLTADVGGIWWPDERGIAHDLRPIPPQHDFRSAREVATLEMDHNFAGFQGKALIDWTADRRRLLIDADPVFGTLVVYVPPGEDFFCVEPTTHAADGFNMLAQGRTDTGVRVLAPGETLGGTVRYRLGTA